MGAAPLVPLAAKFVGDIHAPEVIAPLPNWQGQITFIMTDEKTHAPVTGKSVVAQVSHDGGAFTKLTNPIYEVGSGIYFMRLTTAEMGVNETMFRFTANGADDLLIERIA